METSMKHIIYTSEICQKQNGPKVPAGLHDIYSSAKKKNETYGITGVLAYFDGHYLQVIEGPNSNVDNLYRNIVNDKRHCNVRLLAEGKSTSRHFHDWRFDSSGCQLSRNQDFERYFQKYGQHFEALPQVDRNTLALFFTPIKSNAHISNFENSTLKLERWPELHKVGQTTEVINLCATLLHGTKTYIDLKNAHNGLDESELNRLLTAFNKQGVLLNKADVESQLIKSNTATGGFYQKMCAFLNSTLHSNAH